ncbi:DUF333 domain-containing protein [Patescibacteria group bacterium]|nr:DUF333 domain-containing protein [Patescibacteria group bacterium]
METSMGYGRKVHYSFLLLALFACLRFAFPLVHKVDDIPKLPADREMNVPKAQIYESREQSSVGMANPSAVYCQELGYKYQTVATDGGQYGVCTFPDDTVCKAWDFLKGKCGQAYSYCVKQGYNIETVVDGKDPFSPEHAVCLSPQDQKVIGSVTQLTNLAEKSRKGGTLRTREYQEEEGATAVLKNQQDALPSSFDWRNYQSADWTTSVKDQGGCGACWSFSAVGVVESVYDIAMNNSSYNLDLSEQYHVAGCDSPTGCVGCCGGWNDIALELIRDNGIPDDDCLTFIDGTGCGCSATCGDSDPCTYSSGDNCSDRTCSDRCLDWASRLTTIDTVGVIAENDVAADRDTMKQYLIEKGPLSVAFDASGAADLFSSYWYWDDTYENIVYYCSSPDTANHAVVITGFDDNHGYDGYWIVKNSWGDDWGWDSDGYLKIIYGSCLVESSGVYYAEVTITPTPTPLPPLVGQAIAADDNTGNLHIAASRTDNNVYHTIRYANGSWQSQGWGNLTSTVGASGVTDKDPAVAYDSANDKLHVVITSSSNNHILHTVRNSNGSWQTIGWGDVTNTLSNTKTTDVAPAVAINSSNGDLHIAIKDSSNNHVLHTVRYNSGKWQTQGWGDVTNTLSGSKTTTLGPAITYDQDNQNLQFVIVDSSNNHLLHTVRNSNGSWQSIGWGDVTIALGGNTTTTIKPSIAAAMGLNLVHFTIVDSSSHILHTIRYGSGSWQTSGWGDVTASLGGTNLTTTAAPISHDSYASKMHITMIDSISTHLLHSYRNDNGTWQSSGWGDVTNALSN